MHRPRLPAIVAGLSTALLAGPLLAAAALAAEPVIVVKAGDTLTSISKRHGVAIQRLVALNGLDDPNRIYAGQRLRLATAEAAAPSAQVSPPAVAARSHVVAAGEHLTGLARRYGVTVAAIAAANGIANPSRIYAGQRLAIPAAQPASASRPSTTSAAPPAAAPRAETIHTVRAGETLTAIARRLGVSIEAIVAANGIANPSRIHPGQRLTIPGASATGAGDTRPAMPSSMAALVAERDAVRQLVASEARAQGVPVGFALAVAWQESGWQQAVVSHAGAIGVMQLMPDTADWVAEAMLRRAVDPHDLRDNVAAGVRLLRHYLDRYAGNRELVLAAYYQGQAAVDRHGIYPVSRPYIASITALAALFEP